ncbi:hypothetical protein A176_001061 [Myxococcus hansupus]|uniref:Uncharacterized protein n=1 Tax=Pseudomyxococcus hansupus TaxID=1297742 RepID=A0A0H4WN09_9BACT|nr:hypothetical protein A176_001061 [Myxococcus hansupus]
MQMEVGKGHGCVPLLEAGGQYSTAVAARPLLCKRSFVAVTGEAGKSALCDVPP